MSSTSTTPIPNHVIIGLGGTGGRIIRSLRRTIYEEFREKNPVAYERDEVTRVCYDACDRSARKRLEKKSVGEYS